MLYFITYQKDSKFCKGRFSHVPVWLVPVAVRRRLCFAEGFASPKALLCTKGASESLLRLRRKKRDKVQAKREMRYNPYKKGYKISFFF